MSPLVFSILSSYEFEEKQPAGLQGLFLCYFIPLYFVTPYPCILLLAVMLKGGSSKGCGSEKLNVISE